MNDQIKPLGMLMGRTHHALLRFVKKRLAELDDNKLTIDQLGILFAINQHEDEMIQKDMAEKMGKDKSAILRMIDCLQTKELVRRVVNDQDRRKNQLELTEKGIVTVKNIISMEDEISKTVFEGLAEEDIATFYKVMAHIRQKSDQI